jgi:hypothetical protein
VLEPDSLHGTPPDGRQTPRPGWSDLFKKIGLPLAAGKCGQCEVRENTTTTSEMDLGSNGAPPSFMIPVPFLILKFLNELTTKCRGRFTLAALARKSMPPN